MFSFAELLTRITLTENCPTSFLKKICRPEITARIIQKTVNFK